MKILLTALLAVLLVPALAQKNLTIQECEEQFVKNNLFLLAEEFDVSIAQAKVTQARIWELPYLFAEVNAYNPEASRVFDAGRQGQKVLMLQQLIYLGGKKKKEVELARSSVEAAELQLEDLLRNLRYELKKCFYTTYFKQSEIEITEKQIANLDTLIKVYQIQVNRGNIPMRDLVRLQSLFFNLKNQRNELINSFIEERERLKLLTGSSEEFLPVILPGNAVYPGIGPDQISFETLVSIAEENRPDLKLARKNIELSQWNLKWQKSLAVPDLTIGAAFDQRGGAFVNQTNVVVGIPLALWNRNKGNIKEAEARIKQSQMYSSLSTEQVRTEVSRAYQKWKEAHSNYQYLTSSNSSSFEEVYAGVMKNFSRRNISLIEFSDFMESFNQSMIYFNEIRRNFVLTSEELNKTVHFNVIR